jgi:plasmid stability protein
MTTRSKPSRVLVAVHEAARDLHDAGAMDAVTMRRFDALCRLPVCHHKVAERGRSSEAEHREILRAVLLNAAQHSTRQQVADRLAEYRRRTGGRGSSSAADPLAQSRNERSYPA